MTGKKGKILLMDDESSIHRTVGRALQMLNYQVECTYDGATAVQAYRAALAEGVPFDLIIADLTVPGGLGGKEMMGRLLRLDPQVRAIVTSGYPDDPVVAHPGEHGFVDRLVKPFELQVLAETVARVMRKP